MTVAVLMPIRLGAELTPPQRLAEQRRWARIALEECGRLAGRAEETNGDGHVLGIHSSISHTRTMVAAVIAPHPVGIDVERIHSRKDGLFEAVATDDEWRLVDGKDWETLYRVWTAKEAVLKAAGIGLVGLDDCRIVEVLGPKRWRLAYGTQPIDIEHFALDHHVAAVTVGPEPIRWVVAMHPGPCPVCHIG